MKSTETNIASFNNDVTLLAAVIEDAKEWIRDNTDKDISSSLISDRSGYTRWYFQRKFREFTGFKITYFVKLVRIQRAIPDIRDSQRTFTEIAELYGFNSTLSLSRAVKEIYEMTPTELRDYCRRNRG